LEGPEERKRVGELIKRVRNQYFEFKTLFKFQTPGLSCHAVDSSKEVDEKTVGLFY